MTSSVTSGPRGPSLRSSSSLKSMPTWRSSSRRRGLLEARYIFLSTGFMAARSRLLVVFAVLYPVIRVVLRDRPGAIQLFGQHYPHHTMRQRHTGNSDEAFGAG